MSKRSCPVREGLIWIYTWVLNGLFSSIWAAQVASHWSRVDGYGSLLSRLLHSLELALMMLTDAVGQEHGYLGPAGKTRRLTYGTRIIGMGVLSLGLELGWDPTD